MSELKINYHTNYHNAYRNRKVEKKTETYGADSFFFYFVLILKIKF